MRAQRWYPYQTHHQFIYILQGYLDIVRWLCESGGAADSHDGVRGVDARSKGGWTPLSKSPYLVLSLPDTSQ